MAAHGGCRGVRGPRATVYAVHHRAVVAFRLMIEQVQGRTRVNEVVAKGGVRVHRQGLFCEGHVDVDIFTTSTLVHVRRTR